MPSVNPIVQQDATDSGGLRTGWWRNGLPRNGAAGLGIGKFRQPRADR